MSSNGCSNEKTLLLNNSKNGDQYVIIIVGGVSLLQSTSMSTLIGYTICSLLCQIELCFQQMHLLRFVYCRGSDRKKCLTFTDDRDLSRAKLCKIIFRPYIGSCWTNCHQMLTHYSLGQDLQTITNILSSWNMKCTQMRYICRHYAKDIFHHKL